MKIKDGVIMTGIQIEMRKVLITAEKIWKEFGEELVITAALDGTHSADSGADGSMIIYEYFAI